VRRTSELTSSIARYLARSYPGQTLPWLVTLPGCNSILVAVLIEVDFTVRSRGKRLRDDEIPWVGFGSNGEVTSLGHFLDAAKAIEGASEIPSGLAG
jgi:hypothetical protein